MRVTPLARRLGTAALVLTLGAGLTSCSDSSSDSSSDTGSDAAADEPAADPSDDPTTDPTADPTTEESEASGASLAELSADDFYPAVMTAMRDAETFNFTSVSGSEGQAQTMSGQARFGDGGVEMKASSTGAQAIEVILIDQAMYMKSPALGTGDKWTKIDLSDPNSLFGMIGKATDPEVMFKSLQSPKKLELIGTEDVDGVATNHYRITLDPAQYLSAMEFPAAMVDMLPKELVTDMWVDADNLPRKFSQTLDVASTAGGSATSSTTEGIYSDFGTEVDIEAPPADEVTEGLPGA